MTRAARKPSPEQARRLPVSSGPVCFMHPDDIGKLYVPGSIRDGRTIRPDYAQVQDGVDALKVLMATDNLIMFESFRSKGAVDTAHLHPDHHSMVYQKKGRVRMRIGKEVFIVEEGDSYYHPMGMVHQHEALEDSIRIETKIYPDGGAIASWNRLVGGPGFADPR